MVCESAQLTYFLIWKTSSNKWIIYGDTTKDNPTLSYHYYGDNDIVTTKDNPTLSYHYYGDNDIVTTKDNSTLSYHPVNIGMTLKLIYSPPLLTSESRMFWWLFLRGEPNCAPHKKGGKKEDMLVLLANSGKRIMELILITTFA